MPFWRRVLPGLLAAVVFLAALWTLPATWCRRGASHWYRGDLGQQLQLAETAAKQSQENLSRTDYKTGSPLFDGEWLFGTHLMAGIGMCQMVMEHPETKGRWKERIEYCIDQMLLEKVREFDGRSWREDPIESLARMEGHAAYLGYFNFLLGLYREIEPGNRFAGLNDQITEALVRRFEAAPYGLIATYPEEWYPVDNTPGLASIALHGKATGRSYAGLLKREERLFRERYVDAQSGLLIQSVDVHGDPMNPGRGSGSSLGIFFLHHAFPGLSREIYGGIKRSLETSLLGFGAVREYPHGMSGPMDIDSGPIIFGFGFSATGFTLGAARIFGDEELYARLYSSAVLAGAPVRADGRVDFVTGGPLGNAILLAVLTAPRK